MHIRLSQWPCGLRHRFAAAVLLSESRCGNGCWLRVLCSQAEVSATSRSFVHKSPTNAVRRCVRSRNLKNEEARPAFGRSATGKTNYAHTHTYTTTQTTVEFIVLPEAEILLLPFQMSLWSLTRTPSDC